MTVLRSKSRQLAFRTALLYAAVAGVWILLCDRLLIALIANPQLIWRFSIYKGGAFVGVTALLLYFALRSQLKRWERDTAERERARAELRSQKEMFRALTNNVPDGIVQLDRNLRFVYVNRFVEQALGIPAEQFVGKTNLELDLPAKDLWNEATRRVFETGEMVTYEFELQTKDGPRIFEARQVPELSPDGQVRHVLAVSRDITERKRAEQAVQERLTVEAQLSRLAAAVPGVIYEFRLKPDGSFSFPYASPGADEVLGVNAEEAVRDSAAGFRMIHPDDLARVYESIQQAALHLAPWRLEFRILHPRKGEIWVEGRSSPEREPDGGILWRGFLHDITERKQAEALHARLATAVEQAAEVIVITDAQGTILYVNPAFQNVTGFAPEEAIGQTPRMLKSGKHDAAFYRQMWQTLATGAVWSGRIINKRKNGTFYEEEMTISPVFDASGRIANYVSVKRDVTQEVDLEKQLRQAQKMEAIGQLAGGVAHDFNNILTVIQGHASLLLNAQLKDEDKLECSRHIVQAAEQATGLIRQLLLFSRKQVMQPVNLDLNEIVAGMTKMLKRILGEDVALRSDLAPALPPLLADPSMIEQILLNLVVNSRDAMPAGGRLTLATGKETLSPEEAQHHPEAAPGTNVWLAVSDTGCGIAPENLPHIFEPFFTTKEIGKGTGLGLATVYGIVQQHHGWITVSSDPEHGTTFRIHFPARPDADARERTAPAMAQLPRGSETILLVEDNPPVRVLVGSLLQRCGYTVLQAESGKAALRIWRKHRDQIQLLLTDLVMPDGLNGRQLAEQLLSETPGLKVIYASGYSTEVSKGLQLVEGENFLQKPYPPLTLARTVRTCLDRR